MKLLWKYIKPQRRIVAASMLFAALAQILNLADPVIFGKIIDDYATLDSNDPEALREIFYWLQIAILIAVFARAFKGLQDFFMRKAVASFGMNIFNDGLKQTLRLSFREFEESRSGESLSVLQKAKNDTERFISSLINVVFSTLVGITFLIWYSITKSWLLIPVFIIGTTVLGSITAVLSKKIKQTQRSINRQTNLLAGIITESLRNIELVKSLGLTFQEIRRLSLHTKTIHDLEMQKARKTGTLSFLQGTVMNLLKHSILFILLWLIFNKVLSTGELIAMQFITTAIFGPMTDLGNIIIQYREVEASIQNFDTLMQKPIEKRPASPVDPGELYSIRFQNVVFRHRTANYNAIDNLSFTASQGSTIAFAGPSGAGKSTLVKLLLGLYQPDEGAIFFNDINASSVSYNPLRRQIGLVAQDTQLYAGTIRENLLIVKSDATEEEMMQALNMAAASPLIQRSPKGLDTLLGENGIRLSGGEKQRISIARSLLRNPTLLIFDEATSALDSITEDEITATIINLSGMRKRITLLIAHRLSTIMHADVIYVLEKGRITESGSHETLLQQHGLYFAMWRQQIGERKE